MSEGFGKATFLTCCARVNSCSITSMTAVHFLHQTDTGLALRKHRAIYSITPTLFSPSPRLPPYLPRSVFAFVPCKQECGVKCVSCAGPTRPFSFAGFQSLTGFLSSFSRLLSPSVSFHLRLTVASSFSFSLLNRFAVDLTTVINDLRA